MMTIVWRRIATINWTPFHRVKNAQRKTRRGDSLAHSTFTPNLVLRLFAR